MIGFKSSSMVAILFFSLSVLAHADCTPVQTAFGTVNFEGEQLKVVKSDGSEKEIALADTPIPQCRNLKRADVEDAKNAYVEVEFSTGPRGTSAIVEETRYVLINVAEQKIVAGPVDLEVSVTTKTGTEKTAENKISWNKKGSKTVLERTDLETHKTKAIWKN